MLRAVFVSLPLRRGVVRRLTPPRRGSTSSTPRHFPIVLSRAGLLVGGSAARYNDRDRRTALQIQTGGGGFLMRRGLAAIAFLATYAMTAAATAGEVAETVPMDDEFGSPLFILLVLLVLVLIGIGIVIALVCVACAGAMIALGVLSSSALVAILRGRLSDGCRALHYQALAVLGIPFGIGVLWLGATVCDVSLSHRWILVLGTAVGVLGGLCVAAILEAGARFTYRRLVLIERRWHSAKPDRGGLLEV